MIASIAFGIDRGDDVSVMWRAVVIGAFGAAVVGCFSVARSTV
jgi:hypothetical protein